MTQASFAQKEDHDNNGIGGRDYCKDYTQDHRDGTFTEGTQCEESRKACKQRLAEYESRDNIEVVGEETCYRQRQ